MSEVLPAPRDPDASAILSGDCAIALRDDDGAELVRIEPTRRKLKGNPLPDELAMRLAPLIERLPSLVRDGARLLDGDTTYKVILKPEFIQGLRDGSLDMMRSKEVAGGYRLNVIVKKPGEWGEKTGQIVGQGSIKPNRVGKVGQLASAGFQVATIVVGQAHLSEINKELKAIHKTSRAILGHLQSEEIGKLHAWARRLSEVNIQLQQGGGDLSSQVLLKGELNTIAREADQLAEALVNRIGDCENRLESERAASSIWDNLGDGTQKRRRVEAIVPELLQHHRRLQKALLIRFAASGLLQTISSAPVIARRLEEIEKRALSARDRLFGSMPYSFGYIYDNMGKFYEQDLRNGRAGESGDLGRRPTVDEAIDDLEFFQLVPGEGVRKIDTGPEIATTLHGWNELRWLAIDGQKRMKELEQRAAHGIELYVRRLAGGTLRAQMK